MTNLLSQKAVLASVNISTWTARMLDRRITDEVNRQHGASRDAGRYNKLLIAKEALEPISHVAGAARQQHYEMTQPWLDDGARILPSALYSEYAERMRRFRSEFVGACDKFARDYPDHLAEARRRLNGMFRANDYPTVSEIRSRFDFDVKILPCPDAKDFRVDIAAEHADDIRADIEQRMHKALDEAMKEPVRRILDTVGHMSNRLKAYKPAVRRGDRTEGQFRDSLVQNVRDLVDLLPAFNLTGDRALADITERMREELCVIEPDELRENERARKKVAKAADDILNQARDFMA